MGDATKDNCESLTSFKQALYFKEIGWNVLDTMIYEKTGCGACGSNKCYIQNFEYMFVLSKGAPKTYNLIYDRENKGAKEGRVRTATTNRDIHTVDTGKKYKTYTEQKMGRRFNIWQYNQGIGGDEFSKQHPASFPQELVKDHIISWSNENDIVLDPFMGSGTTAKMAELTNRRWIGLELSEDYCNIIKERLESLR